MFVARKREEEGERERKEEKGASLAAVDGESKGVLSRNIRRRGDIYPRREILPRSGEISRITSPLLIAKYPESPRSWSN